jgi:hypothetical protein
MLLSGRGLPGFRRTFVVIMLIQFGVILLLFAEPAASAPVPDAEVGSTPGRNLFPFIADGPEDGGGPHPSLARGVGDNAVGLDPRPSLTATAPAGASDLAILSPPGGGLGTSGGNDYLPSGPDSPQKFQGGTNFFPRALDYRKTVFVLDFSGSMRGPRWDRLVRDLNERLLSLDDGIEFAIVLFNMNPTYLPGANSLQWIAKSKQSVEEVSTQLKPLLPDGGTAPFGALDLALNLKPRTIILLTDGGFNGVGLAGFTTKAEAANHVKTRATKSYTRIYGIFVSEPGAQDADGGEADLKTVITNPRNFFRANP